MLSNLELPLCAMASPVLIVLAKYIHLWFELGDFAVESACGPELMVQLWKMMFSVGINLSDPIEYFFCQFLPVRSSCYHPHHHAAF